MYTDEIQRQSNKTRIAVYIINKISNPFFAGPTLSNSKNTSSLSPRG